MTLTHQALQAWSPSPAVRARSFWPECLIALSSTAGEGAEHSEAGEGRYIYFAATGMSSAYISGSTVSRQVISRGKIFSIARAE
jgi:hypothetical protein